MKAASDKCKSNRRARFPRALEIEAYAFSTLADAIEPQLQELSSGDTATPPRERRAPHKPSGKTNVPRS
jgi:hypothetical protein